MYYFTVYFVNFIIDTIFVIINPNLSPINIIKMLNSSGLMWNIYLIC